MGKYKSIIWNYFGNNRQEKKKDNGKIIDLSLAEKTGKNSDDLPSLLDNSAEEEEVETSMFLWIVCLSIHIQAMLRRLARMLMTFHLFSSGCQPVQYASVNFVS